MFIFTLDPSAFDCAALVQSSIEGHFLVVSALLEAGASPNKAVSDNGMLALHHAADKGHTSIAKKLLDTGALVNAQSFPYPISLYYDTCFL